LAQTYVLPPSGPDDTPISVALELWAPPNAITNAELPRSFNLAEWPQATITFDILGSDYAAAEIYSLTPVPVTLGPADFDADGDVDADDLVAWTLSYGYDSFTDANGDGVTDGSDFLIWQRRLGALSPAPAPSAAVPEGSPANLMLFACATAHAIQNSRRR